MKIGIEINGVLRDTLKKVQQEYEKWYLNENLKELKLIEEDSTIERKIISDVTSDEIGKSNPASLFFLAKFGCLVENIKFYSEVTINSLWDSIDILLTANPNLLLNHPTNKRVIKFNTEYNSNIKVENEISSMKELKTKIEQIYA